MIWAKSNLHDNQKQYTNDLLKKWFGATCVCVVIFK